MPGNPIVHGDRVRIVCISDTHNDDCTGSLPEGDILIHAGDMTDDGTIEELHAAYDWISALPYKVKVVVAGMLL
jgi:predicted phosphodiesterase